MKQTLSENRCKTAARCVDNGPQMWEINTENYQWKLLLCISCMCVGKKKLSFSLIQNAFKNMIIVANRRRFKCFSLYLSQSLGSWFIEVLRHRYFFPFQLKNYFRFVFFFTRTRHFRHLKCIFGMLMSAIKHFTHLHSCSKCGEAVNV